MAPTVSLWLVLRRAALLCAAVGGPLVALSAQTSAPQPSAPPNAPTSFTQRGNHVTLSYDGAILLDATLGGNAGAYTAASTAASTAAAGVDFRSIIDTAGGAVTQVLKWTALGSGSLSLAGTVHASDQAFPAEVDRRADALPVVRNSVGLSASLLNRAVYDRARDWVLSVDLPARITLTPIEQSDSDGATSFALRASGSEIALRFRPLYYQRHRGLTEFQPWTYRVKEQSVAGWSSWFAFGDSITEADVRHTADVLAKTLLPYGYEYLQIDDGFQRTPVGTPAHWLHTNAKFSSGLGALSSYISARGLVPGLWTNTTFQDSTWAAAHSSLFVRDPDGQPAYGNWIGYVMNGAHASTLDSLVRPVYDTLRQEGWRYFKVDALRHLRYEGYNSHSSFFRTHEGLLDAYRAFVQAIRDEIGPDSFLLACWGIRPELIGLIDATRVGTDGFGYGGFAQYNSFNNVVWRNDPDHVQLARADAYRAVSLASLTGSLLMLTDRPEVYATQRVEIARRGAPVLFTVPQQLFDLDPSRSDRLNEVNTTLSGSGPRPFDAEQRLVASLYLLDINRTFERWTVLARTPGAPSTIPFSQLGLAAHRPYTVFEFWTKRFVGAFTDTLTAGPIDTTIGIQVLCIHQQSAHPQILSTSRHVSCGGPDLRDVKWTGNSLVGESDVVPGQPYTLYLTEPPGWRFVNAASEAAANASLIDSTRIIQFQPAARSRLHWRVTWSH